MAAILINSHAIKNFDNTPVLAPFLSKVIPVLEEFPFIFETTEQNYKILAGLQDSPYCWHTFAIKSLQSGKNSAENECRIIYETGIDRLEGCLEKDILGGLFPDTSKSFFEEILKLNGDKPRIRPKIKQFLKDFIWLVEEHEVFDKNSFELFKRLSLENKTEISEKFINKLLDLTDEIGVLLFCVENGGEIISKNPVNVIKS